MDFENISTSELIFMANKTCGTEVRRKVDLCTITNAKSGLCHEDCKFCAQSLWYKTQSPVYPLKDKESLIMEAERAKNIGAERFGIVTSGRGISRREVEQIISAVVEIKKKVEIKVCASLGIIDKDSLAELKEAGVERYHHNIETSPQFFPEVVSTYSFEDRIETIKLAKGVGVEVCSGGIIGLGEDEKDRIQMAYILKGLEVTSIPINIFVPIHGTPFEKLSPLPIRDILRTIAIFRIILPDKTIKIAAGRESILKNFQGLAFFIGANGILIGGYLTIKGRDINEDKKMVEEIEGLRDWN